MLRNLTQGWRTGASVAMVLASGLALWPARGHAEHDEFLSPVARAARQLHCGLQNFEAIACRRPLSPAERLYLERSVAQACRLADRAELGTCDPTRDYLILRSYLRTLDYLLHQNCALRGDRELWCQWANVERQLSAVRCALTRPPLCQPASPIVAWPEQGWGLTIRF